MTHDIDTKTADFLYRLYCLLFNEATIDTWTKGRTFETAAANTLPVHWRIVAVSRNALEHIAREQHAKGLQRGHAYKRHDRAREIFERTAPMTADTLLPFFLQLDSVTLVTKSENAKDGSEGWSDTVSVPQDGDLFKPGRRFGVGIRKRKELAWVIDTLIKLHTTDPV